MALSKAELDELQAQARAWVKQAMTSPWFWLLEAAVAGVSFGLGAIIF